MHYSIRHDTQFYYDRPVHESVTEVKMRPRSEGTQRCIDFSLSVTPTDPYHEAAAAQQQ